MFNHAQLKFLPTESRQTNSKLPDCSQISSFSLSLTPLPNIIVALMAPIPMKLKPIVLLLSLALLIGLVGCGNKGPLTLPDDEKKTERQSSDY